MGKGRLSEMSDEKVRFEAGEAEGGFAWWAGDNPPGEFFGLDRSGGIGRKAVPPRGLWVSLKDAWRGAVNGWRWGE